MAFVSCNTDVIMHIACFGFSICTAGSSLPTVIFEPSVCLPQYEIDKSRCCSVQCLSAGSASGPRVYIVHQVATPLFVKKLKKNVPKLKH